jgi:ParB family chromosome partitioning protein
MKTMKFEMLPIMAITPNPFQPRQSFDEESLKELASSLEDASVIHPIVVRRHGKGYQIIAGERRWRSAQMAGLKEIPAVIKEVPDDRVLLESLIENLHRKDLSDVERENAVYKLWKTDRFATRSELARMLGVTETRVSSDIEAKTFRDEMSVDRQTSTETIRASRGLPAEERRQIIDKVSKGELV